MPADQPGPSPRGWKNNAPAPKKGTPAWRGTDGPSGPAKGGPAWQGQGAAPTPRQPWSKRTKLVIGAALVGLVVAGVAWVISWLFPPTPFRLILLTAGNETNLAVPHNAFGRQAAAKLAAWGKANPDVVDVREGPLTGDLSTLEEALKGRSPQKIVVVIAAHGAADESGPYFIPEDADVRDRAKSRVPLEKIVERLARLPGSTKKLLVLDAAQPAPHAPLALAHNDFARRVESMDKRFKDAGLLVLCSTEPDQRSWVSEEWGQSIFAHYFLDGLRGAADTKNYNRVKADELARYVRAKVEQWSRQTRGSLQTPKLYGYEEDAADMELMVVESGFRPADPTKAALPQLPTETLREAWTKCQGLADGTPYSPAVLTPHLWRHYLEALLRYEELLRAGASGYAETMLKRAQELETQMRSAQNRTDLFSATGTLAMPVALGWDAGPAGVAAKKKELEALWNKDEPLLAVRKGLAGWLEAAKAGWPRELLRVRLSGLLLQRAAADPKENLEPVYDLFEAADSPLRASPRAVPRPTELHHLLLLGNAKNRWPGLPWDHVTKSLELAQTAEEAALGLGAKGAEGLPPSSERVLPWIRARMKEGDKERRDGQDLLFASQKDDWEEAAVLLAKARGIYGEVQERARPVRHALLWRDRAVAELPYYSRWLARKRFLRAADIPGYRASIDTNVGLWRKVNQLDQLLHKPDPAQVDTVAKVAGEVEDGFTKAQKEFAAGFGEPFEGVLQESWHKLDHLLGVPFIPAERRLTLLDKVRRFSEELNRAVKEGGGQGMDRDQTQVLAREQGRAQGELTLWALGEDAFQVDKEREFAQIRGWIRDSGEEVWHKEVPRGTDQIQLRLARLPGALDEKVAQSRKEDLKGALRLAREAASWARRLPGGEVALLTSDPLAELRKLELHELLCWQAERALEDFYGPTETPFYRAAGLIYVADAQGELGKGDAGPAKRQQRAAILEKDLNDEGRKLAIARSLDGKKFEVTSEPVSLTDERFVPLYYTVQAARGVPEGRPVLWAELKKESSTSLLKIVGGQGRQVLPIGPAVKSSAVNYPLERTGLTGRPTKEPATQLVHGLFRGHRFTTQTRIDSFEMPDNAASMPALPDFGRLSIQTIPLLHTKYGSGNGTVVIVFDCSDSMNQIDKRTGLSRLKVAARALGEVLKAIPRGTQVSLWVFAQKFDVKQPGRVIDVAEDSIQPLEFASADKWDPAGELPAAWQRRVEGLTGYNYTPLVRSIMEAKVDFAKRTGPRTLLVLTDGQDTRFKDNPYDPKWKGDPVYNPGGKLEVADFLLKEFKDSPIALRVVGFQLPKDEAPRAERQFKVPLEKMKRGRYYTVDDLPALIEALKDALKQSLFFSVQRFGGQIFKGGIDVSKIGEDPHWVKLPSDAVYKSVLDDLSLRQDVVINPGDRLRLNLTPDGDGFKLQRDEVARSHGGAGIRLPTGKGNDWQLTVLQNQDQRGQGEKAVHLTVTAEKLVGQEFRGKGELTQLTPRLMLFQVRNADNPKAAAPTLRYYRLADYIAPAWRLEVKPWGSKDKPLVEAFWTENPPPRAGTLERGIHFSKDLHVLPDAPEVELPEGGKVRLVSLGIEDFLVDAYDEEGRFDPQRAKVKRKCLVVRLSYPQGKAVLVQPRGAFSGQEHRFFTQAGKYTGIFWPEPRAEGGGSLTAVDVISVDAFREAARRTGNHTQIEAGTPNDRPAPTPQ